MLKAMKLAIVGFAVLLSQAATASHVGILDRPVPWPWGAEQPFPWASIQGVWTLSGENSTPTSYFTFKVVNPKRAGAKQLLVHQMDAATCETIAQGVGIEVNNVLRAQMTTTRHSHSPGVTFRVSLRAFKEEISPEPVIGTHTSHVMVLSITDLDRDPKKNLHMQIGKTATKLAIKDCQQQKARVH